MLNSSMKSSNFAHKCNLLSQYLKENGSFGDINLQMTSKLHESKGVETSKQKGVATTMDLLPILENSTQNNNTNVVEATKEEASTKSASQMTIFYNGQVLVFNDFPEEKANELMALASKIGSKSAFDDKKAAFATPDLNIASTSTQQQPTASDLPIARRASLHKFFEKRKDRIVAKAPYQVENNRIVSPSSSSMGPPQPRKPWLDLEASQSSKQQLELKLY